jgi:hypothetical protein
VDACVAWWFTPISRLRIAALHDRLIMALFDRLAPACECPAASAA